MMMGMMDRMMELPWNAVKGVRCCGAIQANGLALCRQREQRMREEVDAALEVLRSWDWWDDDVADVLDYLEDHWPHAVDEQDCADAAEQIANFVGGNFLSSRLSADFDRLGWALHEYGDAMERLRAAEWREAARMGLQVRYGARRW